MTFRLTVGHAAVGGRSALDRIGGAGGMGAERGTRTYTSPSRPAVQQVGGHVPQYTRHFRLVLALLPQSTQPVPPQAAPNCISQ